MRRFEDLLTETEEPREQLRRNRIERPRIIIEPLRNYSSRECLHLNEPAISKLLEIKPSLDISSKIFKEKKEYFSEKIISRYDLEEILETRRGRVDPQEMNIPYRELNISPSLQDYNSPFIFIEHLESSKFKSAPRSEAYFEASARKILGTMAEPERVEELREALRQFQDGVADAQFGTEYLPRFLKQGFVVGEKPVENGRRTLFDRLFERLVRKIPAPRTPQTEQTSTEPGQTIELPRRELEKYALRLDVQLDNSHYGQKFGTKYFDTPFNFCLTYEGRLIASVGFVPDEGRIFVEQIQGIKGNHEELSPFKWERALVNYVAEWAQKYGIRQVSVTSVDNNKWAHRHGHLDVGRGRMLYDVTAKRSGFKRGEDGDYHKRFEEGRGSVVPISKVA